MKARTKRIACLPVAGPENPYQSLMMEGLKQQNLHAFHGINDRFLGIIRTQIYHRPDYLHFDWIVSYYYRRWSWLTVVSVLFFCLQLIIVYKFTSTRIVWTLHNLLPHDLPHVFVHRFCQRFMAKRCQWIRVFSENTIPKAARELCVPATHFHVIPEGDYTSVYPNAGDREAARQKLKLSMQANVLLFLGSIRPYKGLLEMLKIVRALEKPQLTILIAGSIPDKIFARQLKEQLTLRCLLHDYFIPGDELQYYFNAADALILPFSKIENSGSVILAMGFAKPIIAPRSGVLPTRLHRQNQLLYESEDELKQAILTLFNYSHRERKQIGEANFEAVKKHNWSNFGTLF